MLWHVCWTDSFDHQHLIVRLRCRCPDAVPSIPWEDQKQKRQMCKQWRHQSWNWFSSRRKGRLDLTRQIVSDRSFMSLRVSDRILLNFAWLRNKYRRQSVTGDNKNWTTRRRLCRLQSDSQMRVKSIGHFFFEEEDPLACNTVPILVVMNTESPCHEDSIVKIVFYFI